MYFYLTTLFMRIPIMKHNYLFDWRRLYIFRNGFITFTVNLLFTFVNNIIILSWNIKLPERIIQAKLSRCLICMVYGILYIQSKVLSLWTLCAIIYCCILLYCSTNSVYSRTFVKLTRLEHFFKFSIHFIENIMFNFFITSYCINTSVVSSIILFL